MRVRWHATCNKREKGGRLLGCRLSGGRLSGGYLSGSLVSEYYEATCSGCESGGRPPATIAKKVAVYRVAVYRVAVFWVAAHRMAAHRVAVQFGKRVLQSHLLGMRVGWLATRDKREKGGFGLVAKVGSYCLLQPKFGKGAKHGEKTR